MTTYSRVAAVTGSNKGVGLGCVRQLALQYPQSPFNNGPLLIYLTARNQERGENALNQILQDSQLASAKALSSHGGLTDVKYLPLDISDGQSIENFVRQIKQDHPEGIDFLINNAGIALEGFNGDVAKRTIACNYYATLDVTKKLLPHIRKDGGRIVNMASTSGLLTTEYSPEIRQRFLEARSVNEISKLMEEFTRDVEAGDWKTKWPSNTYKVSKAGLIGATRAMVNEMAQSGGRGGDGKILINACCPGYVDTDMTKHRGYKTIDQGAQTPVVLALADIHGASGEYWSEEKPAEWVKP